MIYMSICGETCFTFSEAMQSSVEINSMSFLMQQNIQRKPILLLGDSLLWGFTMSEVDVICIKGARPQDLEEHILQTRVELRSYQVIAVVCGGNCFKQRVKNGVTRPSCSPFRVSNFKFQTNWLVKM